MNLRLRAANANAIASARSPRLLEWLTRLTQPEEFSFDLFSESLDFSSPAEVAALDHVGQTEDWNTIAHISGHSPKDFFDAGQSLPLTAAEIDHFRRNHRCTDNQASRDFRTAQTDLPSPLAELYGLYRHHARIDAESALFLAQSTNSTRVARIMADLLAVGAFANGLEYISYLGTTYSVSCAFDTSEEISRANLEAARRLALPADHPSHFLKLTPDELGVLAASIAEKNSLSATDFFEKANLLSEARQDVNRLPHHLHFSTAVAEQDLPVQASWMVRLMGAYARLFPKWVLGLPDVQAVLQ